MSQFGPECHCHGHIPTPPGHTLSQLTASNMALNWVMLKSDGSPVPLPGEAFVNMFFNTDVSVLVAAATLRASGAIYASHQRVCLPC